MEVYSEGHELGRCALWYELDNSKVIFLEQINILWYLPYVRFQGFLTGSWGLALTPHRLEPRCHEIWRPGVHFRLHKDFTIANEVTKKGELLGLTLEEAQVEGRSPASTDSILAVPSQQVECLLWQLRVILLLLNFTICTVQARYPASGCHWNGLVFVLYPLDKDSAISLGLQHYDNLIDLIWRFPGVVIII